MSCDLTAYIQKSVESTDDSSETSNSEIIIQIQIQVNQETNQVSYIPYLASQTTYAVPPVTEAAMEQANYEHRRQRAIENGASYNFEADAEFMNDMESFAMHNGSGNHASAVEQRQGNQFGGASNSGRTGSQQNFFEDYEWMVEMDQFDEDTIRQIEKEEDDDLDDMFWWNPDAGCEAAPSTKKQAKHGSRPSPPTQQRTSHPPAQKSSPSRQYRPNHHHQHRNNQSQRHTSNPLSFNPLAGQQQNGQYRHQNGGYRQNHRPSQHSFNPLSGASNHPSPYHGNYQHSHYMNGHAATPTTTAPMNGHRDELSAAMNSVDINKFNFNPDATSFVPKWMKK